MFFRKLYTIWCVLWFMGLFLLFLPIFWFSPARPPYLKLIASLQHYWAKISYFFWGVGYEIVYRYKPTSELVGIYCANHTSMVDIVAMGAVLEQPFAFVGKEELTKVPLFGKIFKKFHITVKRESVRDAYNAIRQSQAVLRQGRNLIIFPEGSRSKNAPQLSSFKDGAFRIAIAEQVPIIPVTLIFNWKIFPNDTTYLAYRHRWKAIVHEPIYPKGKTTQDLETLKKEVYQVIEQALLPYYPEKTLLKIIYLQNKLYER